MRAAMASDDPIAPVLARVDATLSSGGRVWCVSNTPPPTPTRALRPLGPAPHPKTGWASYMYEFAWSNAITFELQQEATRFDVLAGDGRATAPYETISAWSAQGWK